MLPVIETEKKEKEKKLEIILIIISRYIVWNSIKPYSVSERLLHSVKESGYRYIQYNWFIFIETYKHIIMITNFVSILNGNWIVRR